MKAQIAIAGFLRRDDDLRKSFRNKIFISPIAVSGNTIIIRKKLSKGSTIRHAGNVIKLRNLMTLPGGTPYL